jgi:hypothetical protein
MRSMVTCCAALSCVVGCSQPSREPPYMGSREYQSREAMTASLFASDQAVVSRESVEQILSSKVVIPKGARLAILRFGHGNAWERWSEELAQLDQSTQKGFTESLRQCKRLADVSFLPLLMTPEKQSIPYLREAAARYQADPLLVYRFASRVYDKYRFLGPRTAKAQCLVEAILLDTRTGTVPWTSTSLQEYVAAKSEKDYGFDETTAKAEVQALGTAMGAIASDLVKFLESIP